MHTKSKSVISVNVDVKGDIESKVVNSFKIPPNTVLAFSCNELSINSAGLATLHSAVDINDSLDEPLFLQNSEDGDPGLSAIFIFLVKFQQEKMFSFPFLFFA